MIKLNVHEAKTHLSEYFAKLKQGETIVLCKRNRPIHRPGGAEGPDAFGPVFSTHGQVF